MKNHLFFKVWTTFISVVLIFSSLEAQRPVKSIPMPHSWKDNNNAILVHTKGMKREYYEYNIKKGTMKQISLEKAPVTDPSVSIKGDDIYFYSPTGEEKRLTNTDEIEKNPTLSPDFKRVAFTRNNDLYSIDVESLQEIRYTFDGSDLVLNGWASWVYFEEIFGRAGKYRAFWWSPDSRRIAFYRFDDSKVPMFPIYDSKGKHGTLKQTRYPKAGDPNPEVKLGFVDALGGDIIWADFNTKEDQYFGTPYWNSNGVNIMVQWMDREQSNFVLYDVNSFDGAKKPIYKEYQKTWIDWIDDIHFGKTGFYFVRDFELWEHIYFQSYDGSKLERLTDGMNWGIKIRSFDEKKGVIYFTARREASVRNDIYKLTLSEEESSVKRISAGEYNYSEPVVSPDGKYILAVHSALNVPSRLVLLSDSKRGVVKAGEYKVIANSKSENFDSLGLPKREMIYITTAEGYKLPGTITYPIDFNKNKKYPVIVDIYGGPNATNVMDVWKNYYSTQLYWAQEGVIQVSIDNRASGHVGKEGINFVHRNLGHYEIKDFIQWGKYLKSLPYVNGDKIGITGYSYGGTMTVMALTEGAEYFKYGIAGAGVYNWLLYDSHYTERYMDHPDDNIEGYKSSAVINKAALYRSDKGSLLYLTHGTSDDNVHLQNTIQLIDALQKEGKEFKLMLYPGAMHGYRGYQRNFSTQETIKFWRKTLLDK